MADILGPNGQPIQSNPFLSSSQGMSSNVSVNTSSAERAMADLQKVLDGMTKNFAGSWEKATKDSMAAQERFYRYIGDKDKEREMALKRYSNEAINAINSEKAANLAALDAKKMAHEEYEKKRTEITIKADKDRDRVLQETARKEKQSTGVGGFLRGGMEALQSTGGPIGGMVSGVGSLISNPYTAVPALLAYIFEKTAVTRAAESASGSLLAGAGMGTGGAGTAESLTGRIRSILPVGALSQAQETQMLATMSGSRTLIGQVGGRGGAEAFAGNLGLFANILPDVAKETELFTDATKSLGMSQKDISNTFMSSRVNAERLKITQLDALQTQIDMAKALRNITNDGTVAADVLNNVGGFFKDIGKSEAERTRMTLGVAQAGANLGLPAMFGMAAFASGKKPTFSQMTGLPESGIGPSNGGIIGNPFAMMGQFLTKVGGQFQDPMQKLFAADALNKQLGLGIQTQDLPQLFNMASRLGQSGPGGLKQEDFIKQAQALAAKSPEAMTQAGIEKLGQIVDPFTRLANKISTFWEDLDVFVRNHFPQSSVNPTSQSLPTKNVKNKPTGGKHSSDFEVIQH